MPMTISKVRTGKPRPLTVAWHDDEVHLEYNPDAITGDLADTATDDRSAKTLCTVLELVLVSWDVLERDAGDGEPLEDVPRVPIDLEHLMLLPVAFVAAIYQAIVTDQQPGEANAGSFSG